MTRRKLNPADTLRQSVRTQYQQVYRLYNYGSRLERFQNMNHILLSKSRSNIHVKNTLEFGFGSGEHIRYERKLPSSCYYAIDLEKTSFALDPDFDSRFNFSVMSIEKLEFSSSKFQRVIGTCVLHHVDDVLASLFEIRRVLAPGGEFRVVIPTDPGLMNQTLKRLLLYPRLRKLIEVDPKLIYSIEHKNHIGAILAQIEHVFQDDNLQITYWPTKVPSWNLNLLALVSVIKN